MVWNTWSHQCMRCARAANQPLTLVPWLQPLCFLSGSFCLTPTELFSDPKLGVDREDVCHFLSKAFKSIKTIRQLDWVSKAFKIITWNLTSTNPTELPEDPTAARPGGPGRAAGPRRAARAGGRGLCRCGGESRQGRSSNQQFLGWIGFFKRWLEYH